MKTTLAKGKAEPKKKALTTVKKVQMKGKTRGGVKPSLAKGKKDKSLGKGNNLSESALQKLGKMSLSEKVKAVASECIDEGETAEKLKNELTPVQRSQMWNQHNAHLNSNPLEKEEFNALSRAEKGKAVALWFVTKTKPKFMNITMGMDAKDTVFANDQWVSEKQILDKFGQDEMQWHLNSGRLLWREDPWTKGVYQYKDQGDTWRQKAVSRNKSLSQCQEYEPDDMHSEWFAELFKQDCIYNSIDHHASHDYYHQY